MKKLLIITQKVNKNDPVLGFFHRWIEAFRERFESITVICLEEGEHALPSNVRVMSLGKEQGLTRMGYLARFYRFIWRERKQYDSVFVHMNPEYVVLGGILWRLMGKKVNVWYTHKAVTMKLRLAALLAHRIFSASRESFRLASPKLEIVGHGIDTDLFAPSDSFSANEVVEILSVGRIAETKGHHIIIEAVSRLREKGIRVHLSVVGAPVTDADCAYEKLLKEKAGSAVSFVGPIAHANLIPFFRKADIFVNASETGSLDKVVLEAMACGVPVVSSNDAARAILSQFDARLVFPSGDSDALAQNMEALISSGDRIALGSALRREVETKHSLKPLIDRLSAMMQ